MKKIREVVIVGAARTPVGAFLGALSPLPAPRLGAVAIRAALQRAGFSIDGELASSTSGSNSVDLVVMGNVLQAGEGQAPARQAALYAGLPNSTPCITLNKVCGSGLQAVVNGAQAIALGDAEVVVAGGMESMSNAPYYAPQMRSGARMGHAQLVDGMIQDGLWDVYSDQHMGMCAELCADTYKISRAEQDAFALESTRRAIEAQRAGDFRAEIAAVEITGKKGEVTRIEEDEGPKNAKPEKIPALKPAFKKDGTVTAASSASINDGAAAVVLMSAERAASEGRQVLAKVGDHAVSARAPMEFTVAPADAIALMLKKAELTASEIDLWELNEAFAVVALANGRLLDLNPAKVNVRGGAVCLGHPIGASGARVLVTLLYALRDLNKKRGVASLCIGGGEGIALLVTR